MQKMTVIFPYYMNQGMLRKQIEMFNSYPGKSKLELIVIDDASPLGERAEEIDPLTLVKGFQFKLYRILTDIKWNWLQARNIGAKEAASDWILLTDIDHIIPHGTMSNLLNSEFSEKSFYTFPRINWADGSEYKPHPNSYLMTRKRYWRIGGYDESFAGHYGTDGMWRRRCEENGSHAFLTGCPLARVDRADIADASTRPDVLDRKDNRDPNALEDIRQFKERHKIGIQTFKQPWKRII